MNMGLKTGSKSELKLHLSFTHCMTLDLSIDSQAASS